jgi:hypothetical protein
MVCLGNVCINTLHEGDDDDDDYDDNNNNNNNNAIINKYGRFQDVISLFTIPAGESPRYQLKRTLGGCQSPYGRSAGESNLKCPSRYRTRIPR